MKLAFILFLFMSSHFLFAQKQGQELIDSLNGAIPAMKDDSNKVKAYSKISQVYYSLNPMLSFPYAEKGLALAEKIKWKRGVANLNNNIGLFISDTGNYKLGIKHYLKSYALNKELDSKANQINNLNNIGRNYQFQSDFSRAAGYFFDALTIAESLKSDEHIALVGTNLSSCFFRQKNYPKATEYAEMTLKHARLAKNTFHEITALTQMGTVDLSLNDTLGAKSHFNQALKICEETGSLSDMAKVLLNLSVTMYPDYKAAINIMTRVDSVIKIINPGSETEMINSYNLADSYHLLSKSSSGAEKNEYLRQSAFWLNTARTVAGTERPEIMSSILLLEGDLAEDAGDYKTALSSFKRSTAISDSIFSQDKKNEIAGLEGKYNLEIKNNEIAINQLMLANQRKTQWGLIAGLVLAGLIGLLIYRQSQARKKNNIALMSLNNQLDKANKVKARFLGILSHDLRSPIVNHVHYLQLQNESPDLMTPAQQQAHRQQISDSAEQLLNTMEAMLLWSKNQMDNFKPNIRNIKVLELFEYIKTSFAHTENITIDVIAEPGLMISTDENYLRTIMHNLTSNAVRALKNTSNAKITWEAKKHGEQIILSVSDNGPGIHADKLNTLFDERSVNNEPSGLGFHLIRDLAKAIQYKITVHSEPGAGTTFILSA